MRRLNAATQQGREALKGLFGQGLAYAERFPELPAVLERVAHACTEDLQKSSAMKAALTYLGVYPRRVEDLVNGDRSRIIGSLQAKSWDTVLLVVFDREFIFAYVDLVFGGDGSLAAYWEDRSISRIEERITRNFLVRFAQQLEKGLQPIAATQFAAKGELGSFNPQSFGGPNTPLATVHYRLKAGLGSGDLFVAIPEAVLTALKPAFSRRPEVRRGNADPAWAQKIQSEITRAPLCLRAVLEEQTRSLAEIASLRVGQILPLKATGRSPVRVDCNGEPLLWCELDKSGERYKLRVEAFVDREQELMDDILFG